MDEPEPEPDEHLRAARRLCPRSEAALSTREQPDDSDPVDTDY